MLRDFTRRFLEATSLALLGALALTVIVGVAFRKAGASLVWYDEVASILLAWLTYYGAALAALRREHIGVPQLVARLPGRIRLAAVLFAEAVVIMFFLGVAWAGWQVVRILGGTTLISLPQVPAAIAQSVIPIGAILFVIAQVLGVRSALSEAGGSATTGVDE